MVVLKGLSVIVHSKLHFFSKPPDLFAYSEKTPIKRELHCNNLLTQQLSQKQHLFWKAIFGCLDLIGDN